MININNSFTVDGSPDHLQSVSLNRCISVTEVLRFVCPIHTDKDFFGNMRPGTIAETGAITASKGGRCWLYSEHKKLKWNSVGCYKHQISGGVFIIMWSPAPLIHCTKVALVLHSTYCFIIARKNDILHLPINSKQTETNT